MVRPRIPALTVLALAALPSCSSRSIQAGLDPGVLVYQADATAPPAARRMPSACQEVSRTKSEHWSELDMTGSHDPYRAQRIAVAKGGANVLLVLSRQITTRRCLDCPASAPITDCPRCEGAWFDVVFVSYACSPDGLAALPAYARTPQQGGEIGVER